jgi:hypothetical protein
MINNDYFKNRLTDSIAASSRSLTETNFYTDIYPLLQKVKTRGIQVKVFGGDKSKINITYSPEDSITFYAARMSNDFADSVNNVIIMDYNQNSRTITSSYVTLDKVSETSGEVVTAINNLGEQTSLLVFPISGTKEISVQLRSGNSEAVALYIYSINGELCRTINCRSNEKKVVDLIRSGIYIAKASVGNSIQVKKFVVQ